MRARPSLRRSLAITLTIVTTTLSARAEPPLIPPRPRQTPAAKYPDGGDGRDASVLLELVVETDGSVSSVKVVDGREPFSSPAAAAARAFTYTPARRGDLAVRATIRVLVDFHPTPSEPAPGDRVANGEPGPAEPEARMRIEEVRVVGKRQELGKTSLGMTEIRQLPGAFGDAFRAIEVLPGVTPILSGLPYFFVRGAPPGNTGYYIDGVRVPLLFHFGIAQSVIHPGLVDRVDFYAGGYPARFGRFSGGIISGETIAPAHRLRGEANIRLLDSGALIEAPIGDKSEVLAAGRYGYPGLLLRAFAPEARLDYWDYQVRGSTAVSHQSRLTAFFFGSHDFLGQVNKRTGEVEGTTIRFHRADLRLDHEISRDTKLRLAATLGFDETAVETSRIRDLMAAVRVQWQSRINETLTLRGGADAIFDRYDVLTQTEQRADQSEVGVGNVPSRGEVTQGVWMDAVWKVLPRYELVPGLRVDYFANDGSLVNATSLGLPGSAAWGVDPRLASRLRVTPSLTLVSTAGIAHQPPSLPGTIPGFQPGQLKSGLQRAVQLGQGAEISLPLDLTFSPTVFVHNYLNMTDAVTTCDIGGGRRQDGAEGCINQRVRGRSYGFEMILRRPITKRLSTFVSYTLSRSTREAHDLLGGASVTEIPAEFDRTHVLNVIGSYDLGRGWRAGARFFYYTGRPYSNRLLGVDVPPLNSRRFDPFFRLDWRVEKRWRINDHTHVSFIIEWLNSLLKKEALQLECDPAPSPVVGGVPQLDRCKPQEIGPISVPSIGVEGGF